MNVLWWLEMSSSKTKTSQKSSRTFCIAYSETYRKAGKLRQIFASARTKALNSQIEKILTRMDETEMASEEYPQLMKTLEQLNKIKAESRFQVSWDTVFIVAGNLLGVLVIVAYEQKHVMTSKALTERIRPKGL